MFKALTLAALLAATAAPALAQSSAAPAHDHGAMTSAAPAASSSTTTAPSATASSASAPASGGATASAAAPTPAMVKMMQTCQTDFAKACPNIAPTSPDMRTCVTNNFSSLGQPCQGAIMEMMSAGGAG